MMRLAVLVMLAVVLPLTGSAASDASNKKAKVHKHVVSHSSVATSTPRPDHYQELLADKMPMGSRDWWEQMRREGRLGGESP